MVLVCAAVLSASAQDGAYSGFSPYSMYGIGDLFDPGTAYNQTMGGVGIASRNTRYLNVLNPAAVTARDSLSFMLNKIYTDTKYRDCTKKKTIHRALQLFPAKTSMGDIVL